MAWVPPSRPDAAVAVPAAEGGVPLRLETVGVNPSYQAAFSEPERLAALSAALAPCVTGTPRLVVVYHPSSRVGRVVLAVRAGELGCRGVVAADGQVDLDALAAVTGPLAAWRNAVAAVTDMRLYAFRTALHVTDSWGHATLWLDGQDPIDGTAYGRCLGLDGFDRCPHSQEAARNGVRRYPLDDVRLRNRVKDLLGPREG